MINIENLATLDYVYAGIAEHHETNFFGKDNITYRVKYRANIQATYNLSDIRFDVDESNQTVTAYLPNASIEETSIDPGSFGFLPASTVANYEEYNALCKQDALNDLNYDELNSKANDNLQNVIKALTLPILGEEWTLDFDALSNYASEEAANAQ